MTLTSCICPAQAITSSMRLYYETLGANAGTSVFRGPVKVCGLLQEVSWLCLGLHSARMLG